jgi:response regulator RpfG family c-di-GMP phosphodiesterase
MEALNIIKEEKVDIIILDLNLPDMNGIDIINYIKEHNITKYDYSIIVVTGEMDLLREVVESKYIFNYCSKINGIDFIIREVQEILNIKQKCHNIASINEQIKVELENLNFDFSYIGTRYLYDCICECHNKENIYDINLKKDIYPIISKKHHKNINSIKASISQATSIMYYETDENILSNYFGYSIISKPKPKDIIITILQKI